MWKKGLIEVLIITLVVIVSVIVWKLNAYFSMSAEERFFYKELKNKLNKGEREIFIKDLTNFDWDGVVFVGGYSYYIDKFNNSCGANGNSDGDWAFAFLQRKKVTVCLGGKMIYSDPSLKTSSAYNKNAFVKINERRNFIIEE